jgi:DNA helicase HerA-like ATPase
LLFNICLSLFLEQDSEVGRVVALDEAHKYMSKSAGSAQLTEQLLSIIRLQRHLGARIFISTQEPTISPKLLDLCSVTIVHRFTSPDWLRSLTQHLAGVSSASRLLRSATLDDDGGKEGLLRGLSALALDNEDPVVALFSRIVALRTGEALLFAPSALIGVFGTISDDPSKGRLVNLGLGVLQIRIRSRITSDGGKSIFAT